MLAISELSDDGIPTVESVAEPNRVIPSGAVVMSVFLLERHD